MAYSVNILVKKGVLIIVVEKDYQPHISKMAQM